MKHMHGRMQFISLVN